MNSFVKEYFTFSKSQQRAILALLSIILLLSLINFFLPASFNDSYTNSEINLKSLMAQIQVDSNLSDGYSNSFLNKGQDTKLTPFKFDPNTLSEDGFVRLGLREKLVKTLINYRNKGGKFYNKESLKRIYGLHENEYEQLENYIDIPSSYANDFTSKPKQIISIELNSADTSQLIQLRGIGSKLSMNIIKLREQLGGFVRIEQIKEVYGISDETYQAIKPSLHINKALVKTINLNAATLYELNAHPYLRGDLARAIVDYRKDHNYKIDNLDQIKEIPLINEEIFRKIVNYLRVN